ncbi:MAG: hypothetical protein ACP5J6_10700 [Candidatus Saccharicenans sp.]
MKRIFKHAFLIIWAAVLVILPIYLLSADPINPQEKFSYQQLFTLGWGDQENQVGILRTPERLYGPRSIEVDEKTGRILILDTENKRVSLFDFYGNPIHQVFIDQRPDQVLLTKNETLLVLNCSENNIYEFNLNGRLLSRTSISFLKSPISGLSLTNGFLDLEATDGNTYRFFRLINQKKETPANLKPLRTIGKIKGNYRYLLEKNSAKKAWLKVFNTRNILKKEILITPEAGNLETIELLGFDETNNIYLVIEESINPGWIIKRYLKKLDAGGNLLARTVLPYSNYAYVFKDLKLTPSGKIYQMLPADNGLTILVWASGTAGTAGSENDIHDSLEFFFSRLNLTEGINKEPIFVSTADKELSATNLSLQSIAPDDIIHRAEQYAGLQFSVKANNITPAGGIYCGGKTVETYVRTPGTCTGVLYKWGGFSGITGVTSATDCGYNFVEGLNAGLYAGDINTATSFGSCCAVGVDCSGFISQCWGLSSKASTSTLPSSAYKLYSNDFLESGDALDNPGSHAMLFYRRETDGRFIVYESSGNDWKVSSRAYYAYQISNYSPYRYIQYAAPDKFSIGTKVQVVTTENLPVRSSYSTSAGQLYSVSYGATGSVIDGPVENEGYLWVKVQWDGYPTPGWSNSAPLAKLESQSFTISGYVRTSEGAGISGVVMNGLPGNPGTDSNGFYASAVPLGWSGMVTPTKSGYSFSPPSMTYNNVTTDQNTNYTGTVVDQNAYPPKNPRIQRLINNLIFFKEYINRLTWEANEQNVAAVIKYRIYAKRKGNADENYRLIAEVPSLSLRYDHRSLTINDYYSYRITAVNEYHNESNFVEVSN